MDFTDGELFREKNFREKIETVNWKEYEGKTILIKGCSQIEVPTWAYMAVTARLVQAGAKVTFGEFTSPIPVAQ